MSKLVKKSGSLRIYAIQCAAIFFLSAGWWGVLYPEFSMTEDVFSVEKGNQEQDCIPQKEQGRTELFFDMLEAEPGQIHVKSRLLEAFQGITENDDGSDSQWDNKRQQKRGTAWAQTQAGGSGGGF